METNKTITISILGTGPTGLGLALALKEAPDIHIQLLGRQEKSLPKHKLKCLQATSEIGRHHLAQSDIIMMAVPDNCITNYSMEILRDLEFQTPTVLCHLSGCLPSNILPEQTNIYRASMHPLCALPSAETAEKRLKEAFYTLEGDVESHTLITRILCQLSNRFAFIPTTSKYLYHACAVMVSNLILGLFHGIAGELKRGEMEDLLPHMLKLAQNNLENAENLGIGEALTGPLMRGDTDTLNRNMNAFDSEKMREAYIALSRYTLSLAVETYPNKNHTYEKIGKLLDQNEL